MNPRFLETSYMVTMLVKAYIRFAIIVGDCICWPWLMYVVFRTDGIAATIFTLFLSAILANIGQPLLLALMSLALWHSYHVVGEWLPYAACIAAGFYLLLFICTKILGANPNIASTAAAFEKA